MYAPVLQNVSPLIQSMLKNTNLRSFCIVSTVLLTWVEILKFISHRGYLNSWQRRKIMHCLTGPIFLLFWPMFSSDREGSIFASTVPLVMTIKFSLIGLGIIKDDDTVKSVSRLGDRTELLKGPLLYGIVFITATYMFWKRTRAVICFFSLCFGDGMAEIFGRQFGHRNKLPWSHEKSLAGSLGFILSATVTTIAFLALYPQSVIDIQNRSLIGRVLFVNVVAAAVESLPFNEVDNVTVFFGALLGDKFVSGETLF